MDQRVQQGRRTPPATPARRGAGAAGPAAGVLEFQRAAGNAATTQLIQRAPKPRKGDKKPAKPKKKYFELSNKQLEEWDAQKCKGWAGDAAKDKRYLEAAAFYQRAYELGQNKERALAFYVSRMFKEIAGYEDDAKYWIDVSNGVVEHPLLPEFQHA